MTVSVDDSKKLVLEPDEGENVIVAICYTAHVTSTLEEGAVFDLVLSPTSTANASVDFYLATANPLVISSGNVSGDHDSLRTIHLFLALTRLY